MAFFKRLFSKNDTNKCSDILITRDSGQRIEHEQNLNFRVFNANGGIILEFSRYDKSKHEHVTDLYVVKNDDELSEKVSKILTMANLRGV